MTQKLLLEFKEIVKAKSDPASRKPDRQTRKLLLYLFTSTKGGFTRLRIVMLLTKIPLNVYKRYVSEQL